MNIYTIKIKMIRIWCDSTVAVLQVQKLCDQRMKNSINIVKFEDIEQW